MNFAPVVIGSTTIGHYLIRDNVLYFFGTRYGDLEVIKSTYPKLDFRRLHQVHGRSLVHTDSASREPLPQADAHWTKTAGIALVIQTADCMPLLASNGERILAVHSGWRGTLQNVIGHSLREVFMSSPKPLDLCVGPFIQKSSFEVGLDVAQQFAELSAGLIFQHPMEPQSKALVDLALAARAQIQAATKSVRNLHISSIDTKTDLNYASYRRDQPAATRNISFVARLDS